MYTPTICFLGIEGLTIGPNILKKVFKPSSFLTGATFFIAGWNSGAWRKQILALSTAVLILSESLLNFKPKYSSTLLEPQLDETP